MAHHFYIKVLLYLKNQLGSDHLLGLSISNIQSTIPKNWKVTRSIIGTNDQVRQVLLLFPIMEWLDGLTYLVKRYMGIIMFMILIYIILPSSSLIFGAVL